jgi:predicted amino acid dehydrogenase
MQIILTWQTIITAGAVVGALGAIAAAIAKLVRWVDRQTTDYASLKQQHESDVKKLESELATEIRRNNTELEVLTRGILACLKGLQEKGCWNMAGYVP